MVPVIAMLPSAVDESVSIVTELVAIVTAPVSETLPAVVPPSVLMLLFKVIVSAVTDRLPVVPPEPKVNTGVMLTESVPASPLITSVAR